MLQGIIIWLALFPFAWALVMVPIVVIGVAYQLIKQSIQDRKERAWMYKFNNPFRGKEGS
jgi:4-hydroxybenzoate polyprenyltransferase